MLGRPGLPILQVNSPGKAKCPIKPPDEEARPNIVLHADAGDISKRDVERYGYSLPEIPHVIEETDDIDA